VAGLKDSICETIGVPKGRQRLTCQGTLLMNDRLLKDYQISAGTMINLLGKLPGGGLPVVEGPRTSVGLADFLVDQVTMQPWLVAVRHEYLT
jgi:hypothetical protein